ncbi:MAG: hypothetical protein ACT4P5_04420 [Armatimonadota bacterium]
MRLVALLVAFLFLSSSCGARDPWAGTYSNANGSITLDVKKGGKASFTALGDTEECTYTTDGDKTLTLDCPEPPAGKFVFTRQSDESIVADNPMVGRLAKSKR